MKFSSLFKRRRWIFQENNEYFEIKKAYFTNTIWGKLSNFIEAVRQLDLLPFPIRDQRFSKIYVTRRGCSRSVENEDEIVFFLEQHDFLVVDCSNLSLLDQIKIFSNAEYIVGLHGAALTNLVHNHYIKKRAILELMPKDWINPCYYWLARETNCWYSCILTTNVKNNSKNTTRVNIIELESAVNKMLNQELLP